MAYEYEGRGLYLEDFEMKKILMKLYINKVLRGF